MLQPLPIDPHLPRLLAALREHGAAVLQAPPGSGKTTRVPPALQALDAERQVLVLEPRRLPTRLAARRVAEERGEAVGGSIGYQVRFEERTGPATRVIYVTEGILVRRLLAEPDLPGIHTVVLDEFHERHLNVDLSLALLRRLRDSRRPDLRLVIMSATLDAVPVAAWLGGAPVIEAPGQMFEVAVEHLPYPDERPVEALVASALQRLLDDGLEGDVLIFLPGAAEIRRSLAACNALGREHDLMLCPLHGDMPLEEQDAAIRPGARRKVIFSTNLAESSVTVEGIVAVIDSGLSRTVAQSPWSGLPVMLTERASQASAIQRAGRAGRLRPGRALRLFTRADLESRPRQTPPAIERSDLTETMLAVHGTGAQTLQWFEPPPARALEQAEALLARLGAVEKGRLTELGQRMLELPVHPRQARLVLEAVRHNAAEAGCLLAALLSADRDLKRSTPFSGRREAASTYASSDLLTSLDLFLSARRRNFDAETMQRLELDVATCRLIDRASKQLLRLLGIAASTGQGREADLRHAIFTGFPDRAARARPSPRGIELQLASGETAELAATSVVRDAEFVVALEAEQQHAGRSVKTVVRTASAIEVDWLLDAAREETELLWNAATERVESVWRLRYDALVLEESRGPAKDGGALLLAAAQKVGARAFGDVEPFLARYAFVRRTFPERALPDLDVDAALKRLAHGRSSFAEMRARGLLTVLRDQVRDQRWIDQMAPLTLNLPTRRRPLPIHYEPDKTPWVAAPMQDFFGRRDSPTIAAGRVALVLHLLAPNQRPIQVTSDLAGFWERHWPQVRRELSRRYPRHRWPEDPLTSG
ncbi:MAG: ATP-dependent helicase HrpB [Candidatus Xenobia bacterium]